MEATLTTAQVGAHSIFSGTAWSCTQRASVTRSTSSSGRPDLPSGTAPDVAGYYLVYQYGSNPGAGAGRRIWNFYRDWMELHAESCGETIDLIIGECKSDIWHCPRCACRIKFFSDC